MPAQPDSAPTRLVALLAVTCGVSVANLYYGQPLLAEMGRELGAGAVALVPTATQVGYALGLVLLVPLGDRLERRGLLVASSLLSALALVGVALTPSAPLLVGASLLLGASTVVPPLSTPFAAALAPPRERGRVVGVVMGGLLLGVLLSRTVGGALGAQLGWRAVYWSAAGAMALLALVLRLTLPRQQEASASGYLALLASLPRLWRDEPLLRRHALLGAAGFAAFSAFWATLALFLAGPPHQGGPQLAGLFGLAGAAGALAAPVVGRLVDARGGRGLHAASLGLMLAGFLAFWLGRASLLGLGLGVLLLDVGAQANHVANLGRIYGVRDEAKSRMNTVYMTCYFLGGALGSALGAWGWSAWGWAGVCAVGGGAVLAGVAAELLTAPTTAKVPAA